MNILSVVLQLIASLSILVLVHEFGHFLFAKIFKVRVEKFYLFFNPWFSLFKYKPRNSDTEYGIGWLPLGGYVKIAGMIDESMDRKQLAKPPKPWEFRSQPAWKRLIIMVAGVVFNFLLAIAIYAGILFHWGEEYVRLQDVTTGMEFSQTAKNIGFKDGDVLLSADGAELKQFDESTFRKILESKEVKVLRDGDTAAIAVPDDFMTRLLQDKQGFAAFRVPFVVKSVMKDSPAGRAGLISGDSITAVNDSIAFLPDCIAAFANHKEQPVILTLIRQGKEEKISVVPDSKGKVGIYMKTLDELYPVHKITYNLVQSIPAGIKKGVQKLTGYVGDMKYVFTKEGVESIGGFGMIASMFPASFNAQAFWEMTALLSVILAFMNILPIPALDGGHVLFLLYEVITRRKPSQRFMEMAQMAGMVFLLTLLVYANLNDLFRALF
ncbi:MAG: RIP metalloprotease RseP [Prevotellaceae bacterium]|jgi:regulator of sigma E protease|nr:RIP metalloprotease RseP [Prevotellaceae bacterium]